MLTCGTVGCEYLHRLWTLNSLKNCHRSYPSTAFVMFAWRLSWIESIPQWARLARDRGETMRKSSKVEWNGQSKVSAAWPRLKNLPQICWLISIDRIRIHTVCFGLLNAGLLMIHKREPGGSSLFQVGSASRS